MTTFLIDDEAHCTDVLQLLLQRHCPSVTISGIFNDAELALAALLQTPPDLVFLDIEMPLLNGFDLLRRCPPDRKFRLIFTTAYDQYAIKAFKFNALDYLLKPIDATELNIAVAKSLQSGPPSALQLEAVEHLRQFTVPERIALPTRTDLLMITVADILYCAADGSYVTFVVRGQQKPIVVSKSLREVEELLQQPSLFFRCHHSYLVNIQHIKKIVRSENAAIVMLNDAQIPVSRAKKPELLGLIARL
jgi:two-component system, LytTR family, response regulator